MMPVVVVVVALALLAVAAQAQEVAPMTDTNRQPRGIRNRNPGNVRTAGSRNGVGGADPWRGLVGEDAAGYGIFESSAYGIRAMNRVLDVYAARGWVTVAEILPKWAPKFENPTAAYVRFVADRLGVDPAQPLGERHRVPLIEAMIEFENGVQPYSRELIAQARALA